MVASVVVFAGPFTPPFSRPDGGSAGSSGAPGAQGERQDLKSLRGKGGLHSGWSTARFVVFSRGLVVFSRASPGSIVAFSVWFVAFFARLPGAQSSRFRAPVIGSGRPSSAHRWSPKGGPPHLWRRPLWSGCRDRTGGALPPAEPRRRRPEPLFRRGTRPRALGVCEGKGL